ncbi:MAG: hypothetical protein A3B86_03135 [Candidatus Yanofskybacteria bacterium RIFCSPHIGHO2_02_FULL_38_22b]|uniref:Uncharacterized protein n=1 Tax=Candidatus Yanofskybacteria bacterium RIFCSPHIGHO2_02_FULL_38_22b TaxID=1802673 RepID=A0A1F8F241_9BACT|nr:MAG: hypothetical protein A2816_03355 [Candidatus Yanofskybacteria bacterium RIFCSPHIGHO2_01_FULL_39_44]OGN07204.1 MAG: hypothetical protein A3B86_03135 [Candidatus Yanofskybacteria bacterium RIFCSPHIGHO2_02_FULL_38_22b]OGN20083.1 MAG: hypothetical protein A2910_01095 [Candidatus Yanofskybacteria bacterium RIFCSPLOWO2_01_FULL_39_28]
MYILVPLGLILVSLVGIFVVIYKKKEYLEKLYSLNTTGDGVILQQFNVVNFSSELFPEVWRLLAKINVNKHKTLWLVETEKFLRKVRLLFLRVDRFSDSLIKKIRRVNTNGKLNGHTAEELVAEQKSVVQVSEKEKISPNFLKNEEERLIIEIAQNPKDSRLYEKLGDLYVEMENWIDAKESYEASIELNPTAEELKRKLSFALEKLPVQPSQN